ncbi:MAG: hypothetical protein IPJ34_08080 [Myxococcales bacterium]|nr:hypothetical protein [Myxococcales bacterium]
MDLHPDFKELLAECVAARVEFAVVGGYAVGFHARPRATKDLDLLVLGALARLVRAEVGALSIPVLGLPDLIANKRASGRKQDLTDLEVLESLRP